MTQTQDREHLTVARMQVMAGRLKLAGYHLLPRDDARNQGHPGNFMFIDLTDPVDGYCIVGNNKAKLLQEAFDHLLGVQVDQTNFVKVDEMPGIYVDLVKMVWPLYYFCDETTDAHGPFSSAEEAYAAQTAYIASM